MIPLVTRKRLLEALLRVPQMDDYHGRTALLAGIPSEAITRSNSNAVSDVGLLVVQLENNFAADGSGACACSSKTREAERRPPNWRTSSRLSGTNSRGAWRKAVRSRQ